MSNRYAKRVESEHPIQVWSFDDSSHYVSLLTETERDIASATDPWVESNVTTTALTPGSVGGALFKDAPLTELVPTTITNTVAASPPVPGLGTEFSVESDVIFSAGDIYPDVEVSVSAFIKIKGYNFYYIDIGSETLLERNYVPPDIDNEWIKVTGRCLLADGNIIIKFMPIEDQDASSLTVYVNGVALGQYSEATSSHSLGIQIGTPPTTLTADNPAGTDTLPSSASVKVAECSSAHSTDQGYYVAKDERLLAYNTSIPLAYGSRESIRLRPPPPEEEGDYPSLILDGQGFLTELGRYDTYSVEFWLRVSGTSSENRKIFGPTLSSDGLYVTESILTLVIGDEIVSANVGSLSDPTLIHIVYGDGLAEVLVNAERLIAMPVDEASLVLPKYDATHDQRWLGFWSYTDLDPIYIDCFSIFAYKVNEIIAKRRFIWGQGVADVGYTNSQFAGKTAYADFASSKATYNYSYPDNAFWYNGDNKNLKTEKYKVSVPQYELPEFVFSSKSLAEWYTDLYSEGKTSFWMKPNAGYDEEDIFIKFSNLQNFIGNPKGIAVKWRALEAPLSGFEDYDEFDALFPTGDYDDIDVSYASGVYADFISGSARQPIATIRSKSTPSTMLDVFTDNENVYVAFTAFGQTTILLQNAIALDTDYVTYINFDSIRESFSSSSIPQALINFLANKSDWEVLVAGDENDKFVGVIHNFSFIDEYYNSVVEPKVDATYTWAADTITVTTAHSHGLNANDIVVVDYLTGGATASGYARVAEVTSSTVFTITKLGSGTAGTLTFLSQSIATNFTDYFDQFEICSYTLLPKVEFGRFYADIGVRGYWKDYIPLQTLAGVAQDSQGNPAAALDLIQFNIGYPVSSAGIEVPDESYDIDTSNSFIKSYVSFQGSGSRILEFGELTTEYPATSERVVYTNALAEKQDSRIEVVNGTTILVPRNKRIENMVLVTYLEFVVPGIKKYPVSLRSLELCSFAFSRNQFTEVGSKYQLGLYPFVNNGFFYDFNSIAPFKINKRGFPLFYQGEESGFTPLGFPEQGVDQGMFLDFSRSDRSSITLDSFQLWVKRPELFSLTRQKVFDFVSSDLNDTLNSQKILSFCLEPYFDDAERAILKVYDESNVDLTTSGELVFYQNGSQVKEIVLSEKEWTAIGVKFNVVERRELTGRVYAKLYPGLTYNNICTFEEKEGSAQLVQYHKWASVADDLWSAISGTDWSDVLSSVASKVRGYSAAQDVYTAYIGQRSIEIEGTSPLKLTQDSIRHYADNSWLSQVLIPT